MQEELHVNAIEALHLFTTITAISTTVTNHVMCSSLKLCSCTADSMEFKVFSPLPSTEYMASLLQDDNNPVGEHPSGDISA